MPQWRGQPRFGLLLGSLLGALAAALPAAAMEREPKHGEVTAATHTAVRYRWVEVDGIRLFYREAGDPAATPILLLHGFSASSHMFRDLLPLLADRFYLVAPDYPGFGYSEAPPSTRFAPTFDALAQLMADFVDMIGLGPHLLYMQDFGGPVGFRLAIARPERVTGLIVQNANAYLEGLNPGLAVSTRGDTAGEQRTSPLDPDYIMRLYQYGTRNTAALNPDAWTIDIANLQRPGAAAIQAGLLQDYQANLQRYAEWQAYLRTRQPPTLVVWGRNDEAFLSAGAAAFQRDLPHADVRYFDTGHFALEEDAVAIAQAIRETFDTRPTHSRK